MRKKDEKKRRKKKEEKTKSKQKSQKKKKEINTFCFFHSFIFVRRFLTRKEVEHKLRKEEERRGEERKKKKTKHKKMFTPELEHHKLTQSAQAQAHLEGSPVFLLRVEPSLHWGQSTRGQPCVSPDPGKPWEQTSDGWHLLQQSGATSHASLGSQG